MADDLNRRGPEDKNKISLSEPWGVAYWTQTLGVTESQLRTAIQRVGNGTAKVKEFLAARGSERAAGARVVRAPAIGSLGPSPDRPGRDQSPQGGPDPSARWCFMSGGGCRPLPQVGDPTFGGGADPRCRWATTPLPGSRPPFERGYTTCRGVGTPPATWSAIPARGRVTLLQFDGPPR